MGRTRQGSHFRYVEYSWVALKEYFYAPPFPNDQVVSDMVIRVTPSVIERRIVDFSEETGNHPDYITPFEDGFYAQCPGVILCKWTGSSFVTATEEERMTGPTVCFEEMPTMR